MNDILKAMFDSYEKEKETIRKKAAANKEAIAGLNSKIDSFYFGTEKDNIKERISIYKENKETIKELEKKLAGCYELETLYNIALKVANEMKVKATANVLRTEILSNPEKWSKNPLHFKKVKDMLADFLSGTGLSLYNTGGSYYISGCYDYHNIHGHMFYTSSGMITKEILEKMEGEKEYSIIKASDILKECKKAFKARAAIMAKYEKVKEELTAIRAPFKDCNTFYNILPYASTTPENYTHL